MHAYPCNETTLWIQSVSFYEVYLRMMQKQIKMFFSVKQIAYDDSIHCFFMCRLLLTVHLFNSDSEMTWFPKQDTKKTCEQSEEPSFQKPLVEVG